MILLRPLARYADFRGRASRGEYWLFLTMQALAIGICLVLAASSAAQAFHAGGAGAVLRVLAWLAVAGLIILVCKIPNYAVLARRLHDVGLSAWWMALMLPGAAAQLMTFTAVGHAIASMSAGAGVGDSPLTLLTLQQDTGLSGPHELTALGQLSSLGTGGAQDGSAGLGGLAGLGGFGGVGLMSLIATVSGGVLFAMTCWPGMEDDNRFGPSPRDRDAEAAVGGGGFDEDRLEALFAEARRAAEPVSRNQAMPAATAGVSQVPSFGRRS